MKVVIVDYGMGNINSISSTLKYLGVSDIELSSNFEVFKMADKLILPGVGSFSQAMNEIRKLKIDDYLSDLVLKEKKPILGICLGMQLLTQSSNEDGTNSGLSFVNGHVTKFNNKNLKVPHVGFNQVVKPKSSILFDGIIDCSDYYFVHSYKLLSNSNINQSYCNYGEHFISSFEFNNIFGVQFHPELSQSNGLKLLKNFILKT
jgi:imidazole glycerol-phosphate synthase subunit HisH